MARVPLAGTGWLPGSPLFDALNKFVYYGRALMQTTCPTS